MFEPYETIERDGIVAKLYVDETPESPRTQWNAAILVQLSPRDYVQPDKDDWRADRLVEAWDRRDNIELVERYARTFLGAVAVEWWDDPRSSSRIVGIVTQDDVDKHGLPDPAAILKAELGEYVAYCEGDVYGYVIEDANGEELDSCWGFYGDEYATQAMTEALESEVAHLHKQRQELYKSLV